MNDILFYPLITCFIMLFGSSSFSQTINSGVTNAHGDNPHINLTNNEAFNNTNDPRAGIWLDNDGQLKFRAVTGKGFAFRNTSNTEDLVNIDSYGNICIGTNNPLNAIHVFRHNDYANGSLRFSYSGTYDAIMSSGWDGARQDAFQVRRVDHNSLNNTISLLYAGADGNVGIGTTDTKGFKLAVAGPMITESVKVQLQPNWIYPDYVFKPTYQLRPLTEVEAFIQKNQHLPEIPSEIEVKANGIDLGEMNAKLLQKSKSLRCI